MRSMRSRAFPVRARDPDGGEAGSRLYAAYYAVNLGMTLALAACDWRLRGRLSAAWLAPLLLGAALSVVVNAAFLVEAAAPPAPPAVPPLPYDLVPKAPESLVAVALFFLGSFSVGWACVAGWLGGGPQTKPFLPEIVSLLLRLGFFGYFFPW